MVCHLYKFCSHIESTVPNTALAIFQGTKYWLSTRHGGRIRSNLHRLLKGVDITRVSWATSDEGGYWRYLGKYKKLETKDFDHKMPPAQYPSKRKHTCFVGQSFHCIPVFFQRYSCHSTLSTDCVQPFRMKTGQSCFIADSSWRPSRPRQISHKLESLWR